MFRGLWPTGLGTRRARRLRRDCLALLVVELTTVSHRPLAGSLAVRSGPRRPVGEACHAGRSHCPGVRQSLTWLVSLGCALQVAIGATTPLLEDPIFETSCHEDKSFKFWPAYWPVRNKPCPGISTVIERYQGRI